MYLYFGNRSDYFFSSGTVTLLKIRLIHSLLMLASDMPLIPYKSV